MSEPETPSDDELTTDVDPAWLDTVLEQHRGDSAAPDESSNEDAEQDDDRRETEKQEEQTVGVDDDLIALVRAARSADDEHDDIPTPPRGVDLVQPPATPTPPSFVAPPRPEPVAPVPSRPPHTAPATDSVDSGPTRWQPTERIRARSGVAETDTIEPHSVSKSGPDWAKVAIAAIIAVAVLGLAWLLRPGGDSDDPAPVPDTVDSGPVDSEPIDSVTAVDASDEGSGS
ncbi:hypothetical protein [Ilumatobacter nonamiensis]|uniref:hypothetical protein n=1 Tax=Ilumatobacter nonamiensis TaxID=467093 RepID=UPI00034647B7|nr:hypothetical protein [Ilumatobacter nonamiensis]